MKIFIPRPDFPSRFILGLGLVSLAVGCGGGDLTVPTNTGALEVTTVTSGTNQDADGYSIHIDAGAAQAIGASGTFTVPEISPGNHAVELGDVAANCSVDGDNPRTVNITTGDTTAIGFTVTCSATTGSLTITTATSGPTSDPDGYRISIDGTDRGPLGVSGAITIDGLIPGNHLVGLSGLDANCQTQGDNLQTVMVHTGAAASVAYNVSCSPPPPIAGTLRITTTTSGNDADPDGYTYALDGGSANPIGVNATTTVASLAAGVHTVQIAGLSSNCSVQGANPQSVTINGGATTDLAVLISCTATSGSLQVRVTSSGSPADPDGYSFTVDGGQAQGIGVNDQKTVTNLSPGSHRVELSGVAGNCRVDDASQDVTVSAGGTASVAFTVTCEVPSPTTGSIRVTTTTSGANQDADGYQFVVDNGAAQPIALNESKDIPNLAPGTHSVVLSGVAANCRVDDDQQSVAVTAGSTANVAFAITCTPPSPTVGTIHVTTTTTGANQDADGYQFAVDHGAAQPIALNEFKDIPNLAPGSHSVVLSGVADNCRVDDSSQDVTVTAGATATVAFAITCDATSGTIRVTTTTSGEDQDADGYSFTIDNGAGQPIGLNESKDVPSVVGKHKVELSGLASNCKADHPSQDVTVTPAGTADAAFSVTCTALPPTVGTIHVTTQTSGDNQDPDGYTFTIDNGTPQPIAATDARDVPNVPLGKHTIILSGLADNCRTSDPSKDVDVRSGETVNAAFSITCESTGPSALRSSMIADPKNIPTGGTSTITVTVRNAGNSPVANTTVSLSSTGSGNTVTPASTTTDANGVATFTFSSTVAEDKTITATAGGVTLNDTEVITVSRRTSTTTITSVQPEPSTAGSSIHVTVQVTGAGGGTPTGTVAIFSTSEAAGCDAATLDGAGNAACDFVLSQPGEQTISATYSGDNQFLDSSDPDGAPHTVSATQ
jgi:Bacterial Ig-like domain (group 3)/Bacterial Ig-like domain (group 1)